MADHTQPCTDKGNEAELLPCEHCAGAVQWCECNACGRVWCPVCKIMTEFLPPDECDTLAKERAFCVEAWNRRATPSAAIDAELPPLPSDKLATTYTAEEMRQYARDAIAADRLARDAHECKWPLCESEKVQQEVADQAYRELYSGAPAGAVQQPVSQVPLAGVTDDLIAMIVDRDTPPDLDGDEVVDWDMTGKPITRRMVNYFARAKCAQPVAKEKPCTPT